MRRVNRFSTRLLSQRRLHAQSGAQRRSRGQGGIEASHQALAHATASHSTAARHAGNGTRFRDGPRLIMTMLGLRGLLGPDAFLAHFGFELSDATAPAEARKPKAEPPALREDLPWLQVHPWEDGACRHTLHSSRIIFERTARPPRRQQRRPATRPVRSWSRPPHPRSKTHPAE